MKSKDLLNPMGLNKVTTQDKNRFICNYDNCKRILSKPVLPDIVYERGTESFPCTSCGHGMMRLIKPTTYCVECGEPIFGNITPSNEKVDVTITSFMLATQWEKDKRDKLVIFARGK